MNILIIEDDIIIAMDIASTVKKLDHSVIDMITNDKDALNSIYKTTPDLIFMDINLGEDSKDGVELTKEIYITKKIPVIYITAFMDNCTVEKALCTHPVGYLKKPFKRKDVAKLLDLVI